MGGCCQRTQQTFSLLPVHDPLDRARGDENEAARGTAFGEDEGAAREDATGARGGQELEHALLLRERSVRCWVPRDLRGEGAAGECHHHCCCDDDDGGGGGGVVVVVVVISWMNLAKNLQIVAY